MPQFKNAAAALLAGVLIAPSSASAGPSTCPADINNSGAVDVDDLIAVINGWGGNGPGDIDGSGTVDVDDLLAVINGWGACVAAKPIGAELAGLPLSKYPFFEYAYAFNAGTTVSLAVDPFLYPEITGVTANVYVVADQNAEQWALNPFLTDVRVGGPQSVAFAGADVQSNTFTIDAGTLSGDAGTGLGVGYDVVIDIDGNGQLSTGDLIDGADAAGFAVVHDLTLAGPLPVSSISYSGGSFLGQKTFYPTDIANMGQLPLVVVSHGNGHQYTWYDYLLSHLASYGYIAMSHQNNTVPGVESASLTTISNTNYILANQATIGGGVLNGHIDGSTIIWIGHSRGGEGVVRAYDRLFDGTSVPATYGLDDIVLISSIAPTDFLGTNSANPHNVSYHLIYGSSDGDVCGCPNNDIADSFNVYERAAGQRASTYLHGADHNDFNCCGINDFQGPAGTAIGGPEARDVAKAAWLALIKYNLEGNLAAKDYLWRQWESLRPIGVSATTIVVNEFRNAAGTATDIVIDDFQTQGSTAISSSGGAVVGTVSNLIEGKTNDNNLDFSWLSSDPQNGHVRGRTTDLSAGALFNYNSPAAAVNLEFEVLPALADWSEQANLTFRAAQGCRHPDTTAFNGDQNFVVTLIDGDGVASSINIGSYGGGIEEPYPRTGFGIGAGWQNEYETVRIRLHDFLANGSGLDLSNIATIRFEFGGPNATARGRLGFDDIIITAN